MKKIPTLFIRDFEHDNGRYVTEQVNPGCEWVLRGEGVATRKWDGTCVRIDPEGRLWARREVKEGGSMPSEFQLVDLDLVTGKKMGWEPAEQSSFAKFINEATESQPSLLPGTYELLGPKINRNPEQFPFHTLVPHGHSYILDAARTYDRLKAQLAERNLEGYVFWREHRNPEAGMVKIKAKDFRP